MKLLPYLAVALLLTFSLSSCDLFKKDANLKNIEWETVEKRLDYNHPDLDSLAEANTLGSSFQAIIRLSFPKMERGKNAFLDSVTLLLEKRLVEEDTLLGETPRETIDKFVAQRLAFFKSDYEEAKAEGYSEGVLSNYISLIEMTDTVMVVKEGIVSILTKTYENTGGAHPNQTSDAMSFDLVNQTQLTPEVLFKKDSEAKINDLIYQELLRKYQVTTGEELEELGLFNYADAKVTDNILLTSDGVSFLYNPYEIGAYVVGTVQVDLPYDAVAPYLSDEYASLGK